MQGECRLTRAPFHSQTFRRRLSPALLWRSPLPHQCSSFAAHQRRRPSTITMADSIIALLWVAGSVFICLWHIEQMHGVIALDSQKRIWLAGKPRQAQPDNHLLRLLPAVFSVGCSPNEAGMGSTPNAAAAATSYPPHHARRGLCK